MTIVQEQPDWKIVLVNGNYVAVTIEENKRLFDVQKKYNGFDNAPSSETFTAYEMVPNENGFLYCDGKTSATFHVSQIKFFLMKLIHDVNVNVI